MTDNDERYIVPFGDWRPHIEIPEPRMFPCRLVPESATGGQHVNVIIDSKSRRSAEMASYRLYIWDTSTGELRHSQRTTPATFVRDSMDVAVGRQSPRVDFDTVLDGWHVIGVSELRDLRCELRGDEPPAQPETPERPDGEWPFAANRLVTCIATDMWVYTAERIERGGWKPRYRISNDSIQDEWKFEVNTFDLEFALKIMYALSGEWDEVNA